jgi:hypothetical protein
VVKDGKKYKVTNLVECLRSTVDRPFIIVRLLDLKLRTSALGRSRSRNV